MVRGRNDPHVSAHQLMRSLSLVGPYKDAEHISLAITDSLVCFEMPFFAIAHTFAFSVIDYIDPKTQYAARMPMWYAIRDAFGFVDVLEDSRATLKGGVSYRKYEPVEGGMHQGYGRDRRIRAGLRYAKGGQQKYWLPMPEENTEPSSGPITAVRNYLEERRVGDKGYAPLLEDQEEEVYHEDVPRTPLVGTPTANVPASSALHPNPFSAPHIDEPDKDFEDVEFHAPDEEEEELYDESKKLLFGDYNFPVIDVSSEAARRSMWDEEERILTDQRAAAFSPIRMPDGTIATSPSALLAAQRGGLNGYGAAGQTKGPGRGADPKKGKGRFYALAGEDLDPTRPPADTTVRFDESGAVIDMSPEARQAPELNLDGVRLSLAHKKGEARPTNPPRKSSAKKPSVKTSNSGEGSGFLTPANSRPSPNERSPSTSSFHSGKSDRQVRSDAVDLVVEDRKAEQEEMARERRKGEPAVRLTGQRKVYKAAYAIEDEVEPAVDKDADVIVEREIERGVEDPRRGGRPEVDRTKVQVRGGSQTEQDRGADAVTDLQITRAATPPPHAIVEWETHRPPAPDYNMRIDDNPWA